MDYDIPRQPKEEEAAAIEVAGLRASPPTPPKRGSTLEGRARMLLQSKGYRATTNKVVLDHEIDVWGEDADGRIALVECKEYYTSGPVSSGQIRNFFGKAYDIEHNYGENVYLKIFIGISGFTDAASSLCDRLGILAVDNNTLEILEQSSEDIVPKRASLEDRSVIELRKQRDQLQEEVAKRNLVRKLGQQIDDYNRIIQTKTLPSFLVPSSISNSFWYSTVEDIPFVGLNGTFQHFAIPFFPRITYVLYEQRRLFGRKSLCLTAEYLEMANGIIYIQADDVRTVATNPLEDAYPFVKSLVGCTVYTLDNQQLGEVNDVLITYKHKRWSVEAVKVLSSPLLGGRLSHPEFSIPAERISLAETSDRWKVTAHVRIASGVNIVG
jgi:sporulation protein YlmC with PRC-barrel domain